MFYHETASDRRSFKGLLCFIMCMQLIHGLDLPLISFPLLSASLSLSYPLSFPPFHHLSSTFDTRMEPYYSPPNIVRFSANFFLDGRQ